MSNNCHERYIFDAYAVLCYLEDESQAEKIALLLKKAADKQISLFMTWINLGEVYYRVWREYGETKAQEVLETIKAWPVSLLPGDEDLTLKAAKIKANNPLSYADAYAIAAALKENAAVVTGDREIRDASDKIKFSIVWLGS